MRIVKRSKLNDDSYHHFDIVSNLPNDVRNELFKLLLPQDLAALAQVSKTHNAIVRTFFEKIWQNSPIKLVEFFHKLSLRKKIEFINSFKLRYRNQTVSLQTIMDAITPDTNEYIDPVALAIALESIRQSTDIPEVLLQSIIVEVIGAVPPAIRHQLIDSFKNVYPEQNTAYGCICYALTTDNINTINLKNLEEALSKTEHLLPEVIIQSIKGVCLVLSVTKKNKESKNKKTEEDDDIDHHDLENADLSHANLRGVDLEDYIFEKVKWVGTNLAYAKLDGVSFCDCELIHVSFKNAFTNNVLLELDTAKHLNFEGVDLDGDNCNVHMLNGNRFESESESESESDDNEVSDDINEEESQDESLTVATTNVASADKQSEFLTDNPPVSPSSYWDENYIGSAPLFQSQPTVSHEASGETNQFKKRNGM